MTLTHTKSKIQRSAGAVMEGGKLPPQAREIEQAVLGTIMQDKEALPLISDKLQADDFYVHAHGLIFRAACSLFARSVPVDMLTVMEALRKSGELEEAGGSMYLVQLTRQIGSAAHVEAHAKIIAEMSLKRRLITMGAELVEGAYDNSTDVFEQMDDATGRLIQLRSSIGGSQLHHIGRSVREVLQQLDAQRAQPDGPRLNGLGTGLPTLDRAFGGLEPGLNILAARPSMGKTALALRTVFHNAVNLEVPVGIISADMSAAKLSRRLMAMGSGVPTDRMADNNDAIVQRVNHWAGRIDAAPIYVEPRRLNTVELRATAIRMKQQHGMGLLVVDYIQLMRDDMTRQRRGTRNEEIGEVSGTLKAIGYELDIPVLALSQLSREVEKRGNKRPLMMDLRESGALEQDADVIMFLYRPEYYEEMIYEEDGSSTEGIAEVNIAKNKEGEAGMDHRIKLGFRKELAMFYEREDREFVYRDFTEPMREGDVPF